MFRWLLLGVLVVGGCNLSSSPRGGGPSGGGAPAQLRSLGDRCEGSDDCRSQLCLDIADDGLPPFCSSECLAGGCPSGMSCRATAAGVSLCGFDATPVAQDLGAACRFDLECLSSLCLDVIGDGQDRICTRSCNTRACPTEMICADFGDADRYCVAAPPDGAGAVGAACQSPVGCATGVCIDVEADGRGPYCSAPCRSDSDCPAEMGCFADAQDVLRCLYRTGSASVGSFCQSDVECASGICIDLVDDAAGPFCTDVCRGDVDCPAGLSCIDLEGLGPVCVY